MSHRPINAVEDYTDAFLTTLFVFFFMAFWVIAAALGYLWLAIVATTINYSIGWIGRIKTG